MKKLFVLAIAILFAFSMNAQKFGVKVGMNLSDVNTNLEKPDGSKMGKGYHAGLVGELMLLKIVGVRAELLFSQKGSDIEDEVDVLGIITKTTIKQNINYFEIPVMGKVKFGPAYVVAGPYFGYALSGEAKMKVSVAGIGIPVESVDLFDDETTIIKKTEFGIHAGLGIQLSKLFVEARYGLALNNTLGGDNFDAAVTAGTFSDADYSKNYVIMISAGILFGK